MLLIALCFMLSALAAACRQDGDHVIACAHEKCETVGGAEICTGCKAGGVPIDGFCWPASSPPAALAGCVPGESSGVCTRCSSEGYFLFMGGCYKAGSTSSQTLGDSICETIQDGRCTKCKADGNVFQNKADSPTLGSECILCSDTTGANKNTGVANCLKCTAPGNKEGAATCSECAAGTYKKSDAECAACHSDCETCSGANQNQCTSCRDGKYLKDGNSCVDKVGCTANTYYIDELNVRCIACSTIESCTQCKLGTTGKPECTACDGQKIPRTILDGTSICVTKGYDQCQGTDKEMFMKEDQSACLLCGDATTGSDAKDKGVANCKTCTKASAGAAPVCETCKEGYIKKGDGAGATCASCHENCATCSAETNEAKCTKCKDGFFLAGAGEGKCISCENGNDSGYSGIAGCLSCKAPTTPGPASCERCKIGYMLQGTTCVKACEDETACGGTAGACDAMVIDDQGNTKHYCSYCGESNKFPIDGICTMDKGTNNGCINHFCGSCGAGFFLYMGGCYSVSKAPGNYMCKIVGKEGICTEAANNKYFIVPGAQSTGQSVLACANPLGTLAGGNAYVGVDGCSTCTAPAGRNDGGMAVATCTACGEDKKPNKSGNGCVLCSVKDCKSCKADEKCEECSSGFSLENDKCVSTGASGGNKSGLSTGAIAGIAVAVVVVVGGLVGFLCWWFICRGKA
ncbi:VSP [Giardia lamblia P15]|uniref:VSP n=1 Tax=Giardia intestinalis (strain P15) TaxID=658858 RepID=E1F1Y3_GIAIA|nr:VSP [Giardia lamblia P15]